MKKYWFKPKRFGYGATPISWEGWAVVGAFVVYLFMLTPILEENIGKYIFYVILGLVVVIYISKKKTKEKWKWGSK